MLREELHAALSGLGPGVILHGRRERVSPYIVSASFDPARFDIDGETLLMQMDLRGIAVSSGSACTAGHIEPSHVIRAMGREERIADATLRFSFGKGSTSEDVRRAAGALREILERRRRPGAD
jgi:cysteine desulfurase